MPRSAASTMLIKRKLWVIVVIAAIVFLMLATQTMHRRHFSATLATLASQAEPNTEETAREAGALTKVRPQSATDDDQASHEKRKPEEAVDEKAEVMGDADSLEENERTCGCPNSCMSDVNGFDWFAKHFDPNQQPVVRETNNFDPDALKWWLGLQRSGTDHTIYEIIDKMFTVIAPPALEFKPEPSRCRDCAVVGNSGNLLGSGNGKLINSFSSIIRMNKAMTKGFESDVGNRTTYHIMYPESAIDLEPGVSLVLLPFKLRDLEWLTSALSTGEIHTTYMRVKNLVKADKDKVLVVNPEFFKYVNDRWTERHGRYPSTGMLALIYALHVCDQVSVFGYGADKEGNWHHYWEQNRNAGAFRKTGVHSADYETQVIQQLAKDGKIDLHL
ncbi:ST3 beta-galactoside alpha-2,3-sialyltransferase 8 [Neosynchiropus ocellatus]